MKLLILGGTVFVGRHITAEAIERGHEVTLFHRGQSNPDLFASIESIHGDRDGGLDALKGHAFDAVIDTCGYVPRIVEQSVRAVDAKQYVFVSTLSVFPDFSISAMNEESTVHEPLESGIEEITKDTYGPLKVACERRVEDFRGKPLIVRPGLIVGPWDSTDRFTYWPVRVARGGRVLCPGSKDSPVQFTDARDLADFVVTLVENEAEGIYHSNGPAERLTFGDVVETCRTVTGADAEFEWVAEELLEEHEVGAYFEMPLWIPRSRGAGLHQFDGTKSLAAGLSHRNIEDIVRDTLNWWNTERADTELTAGLKADRERELLQAWDDHRTEARTKE